jgi:hypothetical protein
MGLEQFLTEEDKAAALTEVRSFMFQELFQVCIRAGINPTDFEYETWVQPELTKDNRHLVPIYIVITQACENLIIIDRKLAGD